MIEKGAHYLPYHFRSLISPLTLYIPSYISLVSFSHSSEHSSLCFDYSDLYEVVCPKKHNHFRVILFSAENHLERPLSLAYG